MMNMFYPKYGIPLILTVALALSMGACRKGGHRKTPRRAVARKAPVARPVMGKPVAKPVDNRNCRQQVLFLIRKNYLKGGGKLLGMKGPFRWRESFFDSKGKPGIRHRIAYVLSHEGNKTLKKEEKPGWVLLLGTCSRGKPPKLEDLDGNRALSLNDLRRINLGPLKGGCEEMSAKQLRRHYNKGDLQARALQGPFLWSQTFFDAKKNPGFRHRIAFMAPHGRPGESGKKVKPRPVLLLGDCIEGEPSRVHDRNRDKRITMKDFTTVKLGR